MNRKQSILSFSSALGITLFLGFVASLQNHSAAQDIPFQDKILPALFNPKVQQELEISEQQLGRIRKIFDGIRAAQKEFGAELREFSKTGASKDAIDAKRKEFIAKLDEKKDDVAKDAFEVLLPHQMKRLKQVTIQVMMRESAKEGKKQSGLLTKEMMEFLEIDEKQADKIKNKSIELQKKLMEEFKELQDKYTKELLQELSAKQRKKYEDVVGKKFDR